MDYSQMTSANLGAATGLMQAKPPRTLAENVDELEKRLGEFANRAQGMANRVAGHSLQAVQAGSGSTAPQPQMSLQQKVAGLVRLLGDCEESLSRIDAAIG